MPRDRRVILQSKVFPRSRPRYSAVAVRREVQPTVCARRKVFKQVMMRKLAAQAAGRGGRPSLKRWRRRLGRGPTSRTQNMC